MTFRNGCFCLISPVLAVGLMACGGLPNGVNGTQPPAAAKNGSAAPDRTLAPEDAKDGEAPIARGTAGTIGGKPVESPPR
jgi:hypothetical protein